jgi:hypothetical protein
MKILKNGCLLSVLLLLLAGPSWAQNEAGSAEPEIVITNASMIAPTPEKENLNQEWVEITNLGEEAQCLDGWTLSDQQNHTYTFQDFILEPGASVKVHTGSGEDCPSDMYCNRNMPIWNNNGDTAVLRDPSGNTVSAYPEESLP